MRKVRESLRVLVVDNQHLVADSLAMVLNAHGYEAMAVYGCDEAVEAARILKPDLLISDVVMDGRNGIDAAILIRQEIPDCKVILLSGHAAAVELLRRAEAKGNCFEMLEKPIHPQVLLDRLASLCETSAETDAVLDATTNREPHGKSSTPRRTTSPNAATIK